MSECRAGAVLGGPSLCRNPVISEEDAARMGLGARWCLEHAESLARVRAQVHRKKFDPTVVRRPQPTPSPRERRTAEERAADLASFVQARGRVTREAAEQELGVSPRTLSRVMAVAKQRRWCKVERGGWIVGA
jgi:CRP-like cAMP-binding protein